MGFLEVFPKSIVVVWLLFVFAAMVIIHITFALTVLADTQRLVMRQARQVVLVPGWVWALATLLGGVFVGATYWTLHPCWRRASGPSASCFGRG